MFVVSFVKPANCCDVAAVESSDIWYYDASLSLQQQDTGLHVILPYLVLYVVVSTDPPILFISQKDRDRRESMVISVLLTVVLSSLWIGSSSCQWRVCAFFVLQQWLRMWDSRGETSPVWISEKDLLVDAQSPTGIPFSSRSGRWR